MSRSETKPSLAVLVLASVGLMFPSSGFAQQPVAPGPHGAVTLAPGDANTGHQSEQQSTGADKQDDKKQAVTQAPSPQDQRLADREAFFAARLAALHAGLTLNDDQEPLWAPIEKAIRELAKTRRGGNDREQVSKLLQDSPSDLVRMRSEQLIRRGQAMKALVDATGPLLDRLSPAQKNRIPLLLEGLHPSTVLRAAFDIRYGRVVEDPDDDSAKSGHQSQRDQSDDLSNQDQGMSRHRSGMMQDQDGDRDDRDGREDPMPRHRSGQGDDDRT